MRNNGLASTFLLILLIVAGSSCSKFSKLQKTGTDQQKYDAAMTYYKKGDFYKAGILFEELIPILKGSTESELAQFYYAYTQYQQGQYNSSQFLFKKFYDTYARSDFAQEAFYMHAYSLYKDSAPYNLDQTSSFTAISALQDFINTYPDSPFREECTRYILELRSKLERKQYEKAKLYYKVSDFNMMSLKSAVISIENFRKDFPDSKYNEELAYLKIDAQYRFATNSLNYTMDQLLKQKERYQAVVKYYQEMIDKYPEGRFLRDAEKMYEGSQKQLEVIAKVELENQKLKEKSVDPSTKPTKVTAPSSTESKGNK
ncbi:Outer membrane protein assembly factor BamD [Dyadobacter sp. CECT 9275]|uniref:Outer membrane protein assembly factor BamD n=1 Tax=Dyadobacter helix TaxID=2822344 RepID=A0A916J976_9BACT|nr:outer membrane protein assembly factor BamD [Dyadobacter sp. CECT 9275]CAG4992061.1 Outer membrane protein assembly factor BamD [Dyadobacter sp. CECT 9275]